MNSSQRVFVWLVPLMGLWFWNCSSSAVQEPPTLCATQKGCSLGWGCVRGICVKGAKDVPILERQTEHDFFEPGDGVLAEESNLQKEGTLSKETFQESVHEVGRDGGVLEEPSSTEEPFLQEEIVQEGVLESPPEKPTEWRCIDLDGDGFCANARNPLDRDCDDASPTINAAAPELCDGLDNNCDGNVDESFPSVGQACPTQQQGICATGKSQCQEGKIVCVAPKPQKESCNQKDDDCDGNVDEGDICALCQAGAQRACYAGAAGTKGVGPCKAGTQACGSQGKWEACLGAVLPQTEVCDGLDNNCNGQVDETDPQLGGPCKTKKPAPCDQGRTTCEQGQVRCVSNIQSQTEVCDGIDNDCDGTTDEGCSCIHGATQSCYTGTKGTLGKGPCKAGIQSCEGGKWGACRKQVLPVKEACDGVDNDCDGQVDNDVGDRYYRDRDQDGVGNSKEETRACRIPSGYTKDKGDCDDTEPRAYPKQSSYFSSARKGGGFDFNCDGKVEKRWGKFGQCRWNLQGKCVFQEGFVLALSAPGCGQRIRVLTACRKVGFLCRATYQNRRQKCR